VAEMVTKFKFDNGMRYYVNQIITDMCDKELEEWFYEMQVCLGSAMQVHRRRFTSHTAEQRANLTSQEMMRLLGLVIGAFEEEPWRAD